MGATDVALDQAQRSIMRNGGPIAAVAATALLASTLWAVPAHAAPATGAVEFCQEFQEAGGLEDAAITFGECVNIVKGPSSGNATNDYAGLCGLDNALVITGTTNKGHCIDVLKSIDFTP